MSYIGGFLDLNRDNRLGNRADDVVIEQQHCGGNTLVVYRGRLKPGGNYHLLPQYAKEALIPSIHCPMGSAHVGVQCPLTSSLFEIPGYWDRLRYPGLSPVLVSIALPFAFHISVFSIHSSPGIEFHSSIFHGGDICTPPPTLLLIPDLGLAL